MSDKQMSNNESSQNDNNQQQKDLENNKINKDLKENIYIKKMKPYPEDNIYKRPSNKHSFNNIFENPVSNEIQINIQNNNINIIDNLDEFNNKKLIKDLNNNQIKQIEESEDFHNLKKIPDFNKELLKVFIYIYYYEKKLVEKNIFFNSDKDFYLINPDWLQNLKNFYFYDRLQKRLESHGNLYNYNNIDLHIDILVNSFYKEDILRKNGIFNDLSRVKP